MAQLEADVKALGARVSAVEAEVRVMAQADEVERQVAARTASVLRHADARGWTRRERLIAVVTVTCIAVDTVLGVLALVLRVG